MSVVRIQTGDMRQATAKMLRRQVDYAATHGYPNMDRRFAYQQAKRDYLATPRKNRHDFNIMQREGA